MQIPEFKTEHRDLTQFIEILKGVFRKFSDDNFDLRVIEGNTSTVADTQKQFRHNGRRVPKFYFRVEGDVYVASKGLGAENVDIRSRLTDEQFKILLIF